jgi:L-fucose isomerase-like protein
LFFPGEPELVEEVRCFSAAVRVAKALRGAQIGQVGLRPAAFETVAYDEIAMAQKFGINLIPSELSDLTAKAQQMSADDAVVIAKVAEITGSVAEMTVAPDHLLNAARFELALEDFFRRNRLSAMAVQCWPSILRLMKLSVCALYGRLTGKGMLTACETDILGALSMLANYAAAGGQVAPHFVDWTIQHRQDPNLLLAWHCGNAPVALAAEAEKTALRSRKDMTGLLPVLPGDEMAGLYQFQLKPGPVTFCRLAEYDGEWKMLIAAGEIIPSEDTLAGTWSWVRVNDHPRLYRTLVEEGFIHHASMIHGDQCAALKLACLFLGIRPVIVG